MMFGYGAGGVGGLLGWLWMIGLVVLVVLVIGLLVRGLGANGGTGRDEAGEILRARFARGEITADEFERLRSTLGVAAAPRRGGWWPWLVAVIVLVILLTLGMLGSGAWSGGANGPWGWMMGPGMMGGYFGTGATGATASPVAGDTVGMKGSAFAPANLVVKVGTTVTWTNDDTIAHTVTASDRSWTSGNLQPGATYQHTFSTAGAYTYVRLYHP